MTQDDKKEKKSVERQVGEQKVKINDKKKKKKEKSAFRKLKKKLERSAKDLPIIKLCVSA